MDKDKENKFEEPISRRYFLELVSLGAIGVTAIGGIIRTAQFLSPNILMEPSQKFIAGKIESFNQDSITFIKEHNVYIVRNKEGLFTAMSAVCTHLGCVTNWKSEQGIITCPCHGSKFNKNGEVTNGPAPKPLPKFAMTLDAQGQIIVDMSKSADTETAIL